MKKEDVEIDLTMAGGDLLIPAAVLKRLNADPGGRIHVRLTSTILSGELKRRNVTEEEIEEIAALQLEPRENVVKFLSTESKFASNAHFKRRAQELWRGR